MKYIVSAFLCIISLTACDRVDLYERMQNIKNAAWDGQQSASFSFDVTDTVRPYHIYVVLRHTNEYPFRNIWLNVGVQQPGDSLKYQQFELPLAAPDKWLGVGMDDIYVHRALLFPQPVHFTKPGKVVFTLQHTMRRNPLPGVMQAGIRVEPVGAAVQ